MAPLVISVILSVCVDCFALMRLYGRFMFADMTQWRLQFFLSSLVAYNVALAASVMLQLRAIEILWVRHFGHTPPEAALEQSRHPLWVIVNSFAWLLAGYLIGLNLAIDRRRKPLKATIWAALIFCVIGGVIFVAFVMGGEMTRRAAAEMGG